MNAALQFADGQLLTFAVAVRVSTNEERDFKHVVFSKIS
jgi:hypothetical protein